MSARGLAMFASLLATPLVAQQPAVARIDAIGATSLASWTATDSGRLTEVRLPATVVAGAPRSYQVVAIPVPQAMQSAENVAVEIEELNDFSVLGAKRRTIDAASRRKSISLTVGIPASALAGRLVAAEARFTAPGLPTFAVPVEVDVSLVRKLEIRKAATPLSAQAGSDLIVPFEIVNAGNARETVLPQITLPSGWASREVRQSALDISPAQSVKKRLRVHIPSLSSTGSSFVQIELKTDSSVAGSETIRDGLPLSVRFSSPAIQGVTCPTAPLTDQLCAAHDGDTWTARLPSSATSAIVLAQVNLNPPL